MSVRDQTGVDPGPEALEIPAEQPATEEESRPDWLDPKFASPEDQAKAYSEAQREMSRAQERARQAEQRFEEFAAQQTYEPEQPQQQAYPEGSLLQLYEEAVENGDARTLFGINTLLAQQAADAKLSEYAQQFKPDPREQQANSQMFAMLAEQQAAARYGSEWEELKPEVGDILMQHPHLIPDNQDLAQTVEALSLVAEMAKARRGAQTQQQAVDAGRQQKLLAQGLSGGSGRPDVQQSSTADHLFDLMKKVR